METDAGRFAPLAAAGSRPRGTLGKSRNDLINDMICALRLEAEIWSDRPQPQSLHYTVANVLLLGLIYGCRVVGAAGGLAAPGASFNPVLILMVACRWPF